LAHFTQASGWISETKALKRIVHPLFSLVGNTYPVPQNKLKFAHLSGDDQQSIGLQKLTL
jgi:hypothetical protein